MRLAPEYNRELEEGRVPAPLSLGKTADANRVCLSLVSRRDAYADKAWKTRSRGEYRFSSTTLPGCWHPLRVRQRVNRKTSPRMGETVMTMPQEFVIVEVSKS